MSSGPVDGGPEIAHAACPRCGGAEAEKICEGRDYLHGLPGNFGAVACTRCGLAFESPRPVAGALEKYYPADYGPHGASNLEIGYSYAFREYLHRRYGYPPPAGRAARRQPKDWPALPLVRRWFATVELVPHFVPGGRLLEVGCGSGHRLGVLRELGWSDLHGIEMVESAAAAARRAGFDVACGSAEDVIPEYADNSFDVVIASMVLEHLEDPFGVLDLMIRKLKPGGEILLSTVVRDSIEARMYGCYWGGYDFPRHLVYFTRRDLRDALRGAVGGIVAAHQPAPQDFERSSQWRRAEGRKLDRAVLAMCRRPRFALMASLALAWSRLSCRVALSGRRLKG